MRLKSLLISSSILFSILLCFSGCGNHDSSTDTGYIAEPPLTWTNSNVSQSENESGGLLQGGGFTVKELHYGDTISLRNDYWSMFAGSEEDGDAFVEYTGSVTPSEKWQILKADNVNFTGVVKNKDKVFLRSVPYANYLSTRTRFVFSPYTIMMMMQENNGESEMWTIDKVDSNSVTVNKGDIVFFYNQITKMGAYGHVNSDIKYLSGTNKQVSLVGVGGVYQKWVVDETGSPNWPKQNRINYNDVVTFKSVKWFSYPSATGASNQSSVTLQNNPDAHEKWTILNAWYPDSNASVKFGDHVLIKSKTYGNYLSATLGGGKVMWAPLSDEVWVIKDPSDTNSIAEIPLNAMIALYNKTTNTYLSAWNNGTVKAEVSSLNLREEWLIAPEGFTRNWMSKTEEIHEKKLKETTLPASHDAGTWAFQDKVSDDPAATFAKELFQRGDSLYSALNDLTFLASGKQIKLGDITKDIASNIQNTIKTVLTDAIKPLSQATDADISVQLNAGIRWFDLRVDLTENGPYTHHFLLGVSMDDILNQVLDFLKSTQGEIVVLEMSHYYPDNVDKYNDFAQKVNNLLGNYAYNSTDGNPFSKTYNEITNYGSNSKVILISDGAPNGNTYGADPMFLTSQTLDLSGSYANKSCSKAMIDDQVEKFKNFDENHVNKLLLNLTGSPGELVEKTADNIQKNLKVKLYGLISPKLDILPIVDIGGGCAYTPIFHVKIYCWDAVYNNPNIAIKEAFSGLLDNLIGKLFDEMDIKNAIGAQQNSAYVDQTCIDENKNKPWNSLKELSDKVSPNIPTILEDNFQKPSDPYNAISVIYADYIHKTLLVEEAIRYSKMPSRSGQ